jgi:MOSC domain-containing protein YiiM
MVQLLGGRSITLEITQIGKDCHGGCANYPQMGKCIIPKEGVFAKVTKRRLARAGDTVEALEG